MSAYLYPELKSKHAYKQAIAEGAAITARENTPLGQKRVVDGVVTFEGPHYPKPHRYYGQATVKDGLVVDVK